MSAASFTRSSVRRRAPYIPLVPCSDCGAMVGKYCSGTKEHDGWVFYKCKKHGKGCNFWHWELQYVGYLLDNNILRGDAAVDALGWAEERREELELKKEERAATLPRNEEMMLNRVNCLVELLTEAVLLLKIVLGVVGVIFFILVVKKLSKSTPM